MAFVRRERHLHDPPASIERRERSIEGEEPEPVAWTHLAGEKSARVFYTSLGQVTDFADPQFRNFLRNAIDWALATE